MSLIDPDTLEIRRKFPVPGGPDDMELSPDGRELWVTSRWIMKVSVLDLASGKVVRQYPVGRSPHGLFYAPAAAGTSAAPPATSAPAASAAAASGSAPAPAAGPAPRR